MDTCLTIKEIKIPGCYSGVLKVNTGLEPGTLLTWALQKESIRDFVRGNNNVDTEGNITIESPNLDYFNSYKLTVMDINLMPLNLKGYDCYRLIPYKNTEEVIDVVI